MKDGAQFISTPNVLVNGLRIDSYYESPAVSFNTPVTDIPPIFHSAFKAEPQSASNYTWYAFQYEIAYDQFVDQYSYEQYWYEIPISFRKFSSTEINGVSMTTLPCTIIQYGGNLPQINIAGFNELSLINSSLLSTDVEEISNFLSGSQSDQVLNGSQSESGVNIVWNNDVKFFAGESYAVSNIGLSAPGYNQAQVPGLTPFYNRILGVFYLDQKPQVRFSKISDNTYPFSYTLDVTSVKYLFNPAVTEITNIENIAQEIVAVRKKSTANHENTLYFSQTLQSTEELRIVGVRVSFDVVPKDGSNRVHIVKTFDAEIVN